MYLNLNLNDLDTNVSKSLNYLKQPQSQDTDCFVKGKLPNKTVPR